METIKIREIVQIKNGIFSKSSSHGRVKYYQIGDYDEEKNVFEDGHNITGSKYAIKHLLLNKDLILTAKGCRYYCTVYNIVSRQKAVVSNAFFTLRISDPRICPEFLCWYLNRPEIYQKLQIQSKTYFTIKKETLEELSIPLIDMDMQIKICTIFYKQNEALKLQEKLLKESQSNLLKLLSPSSLINIS